MKRFFSVAALLLLLGTNARAGRIVEGMVRGVHDGGVVILATREDNRLRVRLYGIDAPEIATSDGPGQPFGGIARRTLMYKIMGRQVSAEIMDTDNSHRAAAIVRFAGRDINREMVAEGMAWVYRQELQTPYILEYAAAEDMAHASHRGLWHDNNPQPPWEFRLAREKSARHRARHQQRN